MIYRCELCTKYYDFAGVLLAKYDWKTGSYPKIKESVKELYSGIRCVCKNCVVGLVGLLQESELKELSNGNSN